MLLRQVNGGLNYYKIDYEKLDKGDEYVLPCGLLQVGVSDRGRKMLDNRTRKIARYR